MYSRLLADYGWLHVIADEIKNPPFMKEIKRFIERKHGSSLFQPWDMQFVRSTAEPGIQAADVVAGSVARCFERAANDSVLDDYLNILEPRFGVFANFPDYTSRAIVEPSALGPTDHDATIANRAVSEAAAFINDHIDSDDCDIRSQVVCIQSLLTHYGVNSEKWVPTRVLCDAHLSAFGVEISPRRLRLTVIGRLRDAGLLVASQRAGGYKIAVRAADMTEFVNTLNEKVKKMVVRVELARNKVLSATEQSLDILAPDEFANLRKAIEGMRSLPSRPGVPP